MKIAKDGKNKLFLRFASLICTLVFLFALFVPACAFADDAVSDESTETDTSEAVSENDEDGEDSENISDDADTVEEVYGGEEHEKVVGGAIYNEAAGFSFELPENNAGETEKLDWKKGKSLKLTLIMEKGFKMPSFFLLQINDDVYTVHLDGNTNDEGIVFNPATLELSIDAAYWENECAVIIIGSAVGVHAYADELVGMSVEEDLHYDFSAAKPMQITLKLDENCTLPEELHVIINDVLYRVATDGTEYNEGVYYTPSTGVLTIDNKYVRIGWVVSLRAEAVQDETEEEAEEAKDIYVSVRATGFVGLDFSLVKYDTKLDSDNSVVILSPGQALAVEVSAADGYALPEAIYIRIMRDNGNVLEEVFRFDGKDNADFLSYDPQSGQIKIASNKLLDLDQVIFEPVPKAVQTPTATPEPTIPVVNFWDR
jgi:hypothetical protein